MYYRMIMIIITATITIVSMCSMQYCTKLSVECTQKDLVSFIVIG